MNFDPGLAVGGVLGGFLVGLTGVGGGALLTPMLVFFFGVDPKVAVGSDLVVSLLMKPVGAWVHLRERTVRWDVVRRLSFGSVPGALAGVVILSQIDAETADSTIKKLLGVALLLAATVMVLRERLHHYGETHELPDTPRPERRVATVVLGLAGGVLVGLTSVGSGSLMIVVLAMLYPHLPRPQLVGTDIVQAIPLVGAAALGHLLLGDVRFGVTASLLVGAWPGIYVGARVSARHNSQLIRAVLPVVLAASALKLLGVF
jgi:uncharacterized membrane protein YfcA